MRPMKDAFSLRETVARAVPWLEPQTFKRRKLRQNDFDSIYACTDRVSVPGGGCTDAWGRQNKLWKATCGLTCDDHTMPWHAGTVDNFIEFTFRASFVDKENFGQKY